MPSNFKETSMFDTKHKMVVMANEQQKQKIFDEFMNKRLAAERLEHEQRLQYIKDLNQQRAAAEAKGRKAEVTRLNAALKVQLSAEQEYQKQVEILRQEATDAACEYEKNSFKKMGVAKQLEYTKQVAAELATRKQAVEAMIAHYNQLGKLTEDQQADLAALTTELTDLTKKDSGHIDIANKALADVRNLFDAIATKAEKAAAAKSDYEDKEKQLAEKRAEYAARQLEMEAEIEKVSKQYGKKRTKEQDTELKNEIAAIKKKYKEEKKSGDKSLEAIEKSIAALEQEAKEKLEAADATEKAAKSEMTLKEKREKTAAAINKAADMINSAIDDSLKALYGDQARMLGRLQGTDFDWSKAVDKVVTNIGLSGMFSQQKVVQQMVKLVDSGVAYNLELRAFLAEATESIASTFSAFDASLLRIIRIQQADTTAARLGMEASLTKLFNDYFEDTSYLAKDISDSVSEAILDASATMTRDEALSFEYTLQKWLGSLYSLGMSSDAVTMIARGINYLGTGNISALSSNEELQRLLTMSAARTDTPYNDLLQKVLTSEETNDLLREMIEYLAEIAESETDLVTKSAYADLFGMSITDLRIFSSLSTAEIEALHKKTETYTSLVGETATQLDLILSRKNAAELTDTLIENAMTGAAQNIGSNVVTYGLWKGLNLASTLAEFEIPGILALGSGTSSGIKPIELAKAAYAGLGLVGSLTEALMNGSFFGVPGERVLDTWNFKATTDRGNLLSLKAGALKGGVVEKLTSYSSTMGVGSASSTDISTVSIQNAYDTAAEAQGTSSEEIQEQKEIPQKIYEAIAADTGLSVIGLLQGVNSRLDFLAALQGGVTYDPEVLVTSGEKLISSPIISVLQDTNLTSTSILELLTDINDRLDPHRVFYTAIAGMLTKDTAEQIFTLSSQIATAKAVSTSTSQEDTAQAMTNVAKAVSSIGVGGKGVVKQEETNENLSNVIEEAVSRALALALSNLGTTTMSSPIHVTGGLNW